MDFGEGNIFSREEARAYLNWMKAKVNEYHYLARFKSTRPFVVDYPDAYTKKIHAQIVLGINQWQRPFDQLRKIYPNLKFCKYIGQRLKYNI